MHTRKPVRTGKTTAPHCLMLRVESRHITDVTLDALINHRWAASSGVAVIIQDSFVVLRVVVGGGVRWGVVAPPSDLEGQDYVGCSMAVIYSTLPSTGLSGYPVGSTPSLLLVFWHWSGGFMFVTPTWLMERPGRVSTGTFNRGRIANRGQLWCHSKEVPFPSHHEDLHDEQHYCCTSAPIISLFFRQNAIVFFIQVSWQKYELGLDRLFSASLLRCLIIL